MATEPQKTTTGTVTFDKAQVTARERNETYINGILNGESTVNDAKGELLPVMGFWDGKGYSRATLENTAAITETSIRRISIDMPPDAAGTRQTRYFNQVAHLNGTESESGLKATAWEEIDQKGKPVWVDKDGKPTLEGQGKREIRESFTGFLEPGKDTLPLNDGVQGRLNPQTLTAIEFEHRLDTHLAATIGKEKVEKIFHSHSFGSVNLRAARAVSEINGMGSSSRALMMDAGLIGDMQSDVLKQAMNDPNSAFTKQLKTVMGDTASPDKIQAASKKLDENNLLLTPVRESANGEWHGSHVANATPGKGWLKGISQLVEDGVITGKDHTIEGNKNPHGDVVLVRTRDVPGYKTSSALGFVDPAHQEVPIMHSATNADNFVVAVHKSNGKPPITAESVQEANAAFSAMPLAAAIKALGGNGTLVMDSAVEGSKGHYGQNIKLMGKALASIFSQTDQEASVQPPSHGSAVKTASIIPK